MNRSSWGMDGQEYLGPEQEHQGIPRARPSHTAMLSERTRQVHPGMLPIRAGRGPEIAVVVVTIRLYNAIPHGKMPQLICSAKRPYTISDGQM